MPSVLKSLPSDCPIFDRRSFLALGAAAALGAAVADAHEATHDGPDDPALLAFPVNEVRLFLRAGDPSRFGHRYQRGLQDVRAALETSGALVRADAWRINGADCLLGNFTIKRRAIDVTGAAALHAWLGASSERLVRLRRGSYDGDAMNAGELRRILSDVAGWRA